MKKMIITSLTALLMTGCTSHIADLTVASTKNFNLNSGHLEVGPLVEGKSTVPVIIFSFGSPSVEEAINDAIKKDRCAVALSDVVINYKNYAFIVGARIVSAKGTLILDRSLAGCTITPLDNKELETKGIQPVSALDNKELEANKIQPVNSAVQKKSVQPINKKVGK